MAQTLDTLPVEIVLLILQHLRISDLLAFSATTRVNQTLAYHVLNALDLAVFPRKGQIQTALLDGLLPANAPDSKSGDEDSWELNSSYQIGKTTPTQSISSHTLKEQPGGGPSEMLSKQICEQNEIAFSVLSNPSLQNLKALTLRMYEMTSANLTEHIARNMPRLRTLNLKFFHRTVKDSTISDEYWRNAPKGTPAWNALAGVGDVNKIKLRLTGLRELSVERAGLTGVQLQRWIEANPYLKKLKLNNVKGVDLEFIESLANYVSSGKSVLEEIRLENCPQLVMKRSEHWSWLKQFGESRFLTVFSLWQCHNIAPQTMELVLNGESSALANLEVFVTPEGSVVRNGVLESQDRRKTELRERISTINTLIEVDPAYEAQPKGITA